MLIIAHRMSEPIVEWLGASCGKHGAYTFYKGFKLTANGKTRKYLLGEFYFLRNSKDRPICIAEFQLLWHDANTDNKLASARLYFRPESMPGGRQSSHGKDELLCTDEKVVINCKDMNALEYDGTGWSYGVKAISELSLQEVPCQGSDVSEDAKKFRLLKRKSKTKTPMTRERIKMVILTFPAYCRFKSLMKKLSNGLVLTKMAMKAFGGVIQCTEGTWVSFSRQSFHHPGLAKFDMFMTNKAPIFKGRPRKKKVSKSTAPKRQIKVKQENGNVAEPALQETDSSDGNHTDVSEASSNQDLPCPPKLITNIKEEKPIGVIRTVKEVSLKPAAIPPVPKLVKIEQTQSISYGTFTESRLMHANQISGCQKETNIPLNVRFSGNLIASSQNRVAIVRQTRENHSSVSIKPPLVSHARTVTTGHHAQPQMSTIITNTISARGEAAPKPRTSNENEAGNEQPLKRKRGRPPGKSNKCLKSSEIVRIAPKPVEVDQVHVKVEPKDVCKRTLEDCVDFYPDCEEGRKFMENLKVFMKKRGYPIDKLPALGFRKVNLFKMYKVTQALGGYDEVTRKRLWRRVYRGIGGAASITSAATNTRRHYENLLLPYERYLKGENHLLSVKRQGTLSPEPAGFVSPQKDQNGNVLCQSEAVIHSTSQKRKFSETLVATQISTSKPALVVVSQQMKPNELNTRLKIMVSEQKSQPDTRLKPNVTCHSGRAGSLLKPAVTRVVMSHKHSRSKPAVLDLTSTQDTRLKPAETGVTSQLETRLRTGMVPDDTSSQPASTVALSQQVIQSKPTNSGVLGQQNIRMKPADSGVTSQQNNWPKPSVSSVMFRRDIPLMPVVSGVKNRQNNWLKPEESTVKSHQEIRLKSAVPGIMSEQHNRSKQEGIKAINRQSNRLQSTVTGFMSPHDVHDKPEIIAVMNLQDTRLQTCAAGVLSQEDTRLKLAVTKTQQEVRLKPAVTSVISQQNDVVFKSAVSRRTPVSQRNMPHPGPEDRKNASNLTSMNVSNKTYSSRHAMTSHPQKIRKVENAYYTKPGSVNYHSQHDRQAVANSDTIHQYSIADLPVEFVTTGSRNSPGMLFSSNADKLSSARYPTFDTQAIHHKTKSDFAAEQVNTSESLNKKKEYSKKEYGNEEFTGIYAHQNTPESRVSEFESKPKYVSRYEHANEFTVPHGYLVEESRDMRKLARENGDEILLTNASSSKHSAHDVIYQLPVFQPSHYPHGSFEVYDLPNTAFPVRPSSRIIMPPHQVFPGSAHPAFSSYTPHIIATIGTDPNTLYQLPMPGYYSHEMAFPMDTGVQILHS